LRPPLTERESGAAGAADGRLEVAWLGRVGFEEAFDLQRRVLEGRVRGERCDTLLLLEHPHVYTLGRRGGAGDVLADAAALEALGARVVETDRGGEATYHGPGQLVGYPIVDLRTLGVGPVAYVRMLEDVVIATLEEYGVVGHRVKGRTGVWTGGAPDAPVRDGGNPAGRKMAAIGVRVSRGVSMHGFALNVCTDVGYFRHIVPCGMPGLKVSSISLELGRRVEVPDAARVAARRLAEALGLAPVWVAAGELAGGLSSTAGRRTPFP